MCANRTLVTSIVSCRVMSCHVVSCPILSYHVLLCSVVQWFLCAILLVIHFGCCASRAIGRLQSEQWKEFRAREHCWQGLSPSWIWHRHQETSGTDWASIWRSSFPSFLTPPFFSSPVDSSADQYPKGREEQETRRVGRVPAQAG